MADDEALTIRLKEAFNALDTDGDGQISHGDLKSCLEESGITPSDEEIEKLVALSDQNGTGSIGFEEFASAVVELGINVRIQIKIVMMLRKAFLEMDTDGTGTLSADNIREALNASGVANHVTDDQIRDFIAKADTSGDGQISWEDFLSVVEAGLAE